VCHESFKNRLAKSLNALWVSVKDLASKRDRPVSIYRRFVNFAAGLGDELGKVMNLSIDG
jgi:hypothetical protein